MIGSLSFDRVRIMEATTLSEDYGPEKQQYNMSEFMEYMSSDLLIFPSSDPTNYYVFWIQEGDAGDLHPPTALPALVNSSCTSTSQDQAAIGERIKQCLQNLSWCFWDSLLIQFWEPRIINGRRSLTTSRQPFALKTLYKGLSWYRKHCTHHDVLVADEGADKDGLGPLGRVFLNGQPESSPDLRFYSIKEYPLRDHALRFGLRRYMALPVFELQGNCCMGVLELVSFNSKFELPLVYFELSRAAFEQSNLRLLHMDGHSNTQTEGRKLALSEIKQMFKVVNETPNIPLALAWVPCQGCSGNGKKCMERALYTCDSEWNKQYELIHCDFLQACLFHKLQQGKGVAGRALSSTHKLCFSRSIYGFNITDYPLAHYARKAMLAVSFAICLQCAHTGSDLYVLEFFICPGGNHDEGNPRSLIHSLLVRMMRQLLSFKVASGHNWGEELIVEILRFGMDDEPVYFQKSPSDRDRYPLEFKVSSAPESPAQAEQRSQPSDRSHQPLEIAGGDVDPSAHEAGNTSAITSTLPRGAEETAASIERKKKNTSFQISLEDIQSRYGMPRKKAAESLDVSESTLKRLCREYNIPRWRSRTSNKANHSLCEVKSPDKTGQEAGYSGATTPSYSNPSTCSITVEDTKLVIKANYQSKTVKFPVCASSGIATLEEQVAKRLKLKIGDFEISYEDEERQSILLTCDDDWRFYTNTLTSSGSTTIRLSVTSS